MWCPLDKQLFVQNVKMYCQLRGVKPTVACRESGVGTSFINNIEARGQVPSVEKVQLLAQYLGVSTSDLLGEKPTGPGDKKEPAPKNGGGNIAKLAALLEERGVAVDKLTDAQIEKLVKLLKVALEE